MEFDLRNTAHGFVYLAREVAGDMCVKIGFSRNPLVRIKDTFNPRVIEIGFAYPCLRSSETKLHLILKKYCIRQEWFLWNDEVKQAVRVEANYWLKMFGEPSTSRLVVESRDKTTVTSWDWDLDWDNLVLNPPKQRTIPDDSCPF